MQGEGGVGERKKSFVCMQGRSCIINIINKHKHCNHYVISSSDVGDVSSVGVGVVGRPPRVPIVGVPATFGGI